MKDPVQVPEEILQWALDRLQEAGLSDTPEFKELEEASKQIKWERVEPVAH